MTMGMQNDRHKSDRHKSDRHKFKGQRSLQGRCQQLAIAVVLSCVSLGILMGVLLGAPQRAIALDYTNVPLNGTDFSGKDLRDSTFIRSQLKEANLSGADLQGVSFFSANLIDANLEGADLRGAILDKAKISRTNFKNARMEGISMFTVVFGSADIAGADFTDAMIDPRILPKLCDVATGTNPVTGNSTRETLMCD